MVFGQQGGWQHVYAQIVICVEPVGQNVTQENFDDTIDMMDALSAGLRNLSCITKSHLTWNMHETTGPEGFIAGQGYWAIICNVEGTG